MCGEEMMKGDGVGTGSLSHSSTVEKLYAWEKKLFLEVKVQYLIVVFSSSRSSCLFYF